MKLALIIYGVIGIVFAVFESRQPEWKERPFTGDGAVFFEVLAMLLQLLLWPVIVVSTVISILRGAA
jgi:hypothetical protein